MANARNTNTAPALNHTPTISDTVPKCLNTSTLLALASFSLWILLGRQEGNLHLGRWKQDLHGARMDPRPEEASLLQDRSKSLLQRQSTSQGNMGDSEPPDILCESCACINLQSCMFIISETLHEERASEIPSYQLLGT